MKSSVLLLALFNVAAALVPLFGEDYINSIPDSYIVEYRETVSLEDADNHLATFTFEPTFRYKHALNGFAAKLSADDLATLRSQPELIKSIEFDQMMHASQVCTGSCGTPYQYGSWGQARVAVEKFPLGSQYAYPGTGGDGVDAYIIDTGIYVENNDFQGRARFGFKASSSWTNTDANGHGTHVASTVGGVKYGIAPNTQLIAVKVLGDNGSGTNSGVIAGVDYAISAAKSSGRKSVANMSLGGGFSSALNTAVNNAMNTLTMVVAAGNDNADACSYSPASAASVVTVGATDEGLGQDIRSYFSNYGSCLDIFAPGSAITAAWIGSPSAINTISGTSMASPHVCGVAALYLADSTSALTPSQVKTALLDRAVGTAQGNQIRMDCTRTACYNSPNLMVQNCCA